MPARSPADGGPPLPSEPVSGLHGRYRDVLRAADGSVLVDHGWRPNAIVTDFRRLLAAFVRGAPVSADGIVGLQFGAGSPSWDVDGVPTPTGGETGLVDPSPHLVGRDELELSFVDPDTGAPSAAATRSLQVRALLGPGSPPWPDLPAGPHATSTLREFGLVGRLDGTEVLLNYRTHPAIAKDPVSTLDRTIWLVF